MLMDDVIGVMRMWCLYNATLLLPVVRSFSSFQGIKDSSWNALGPSLASLLDCVLGCCSLRC